MHKAERPITKRTVAVLIHNRDRCISIVRKPSERRHCKIAHIPIMLALFPFFLLACGTIHQAPSADAQVSRQPAIAVQSPTPVTTTQPSGTTMPTENPVNRTPIAAPSPMPGESGTHNATPSSRLPNMTKALQEDILSLVGMVYPLQESFVVTVEAGGSVEGAACYEVHVGSPNEETTTTMALFAVEPLTHTIYALDRVSGQYERLASIPFKPILDQALETIMSSPKTSSNSEDYLLAHPEEVQTILDLGDDALPYLISIHDNGKRDLRSAIAQSLCQKIHNGLNIVSVLSPNERYRMETYGIRTDITAGGIYPAAGIRLVDLGAGTIPWSMEPGYYRTTIHWSSDSRFAAVYYEARTTGSTIILDIQTMEPVLLPTPEDLYALTEVNITARSFRPDPYLEAAQWLEDTVLKVNFRWTGETTEDIHGWFEYDIANATVRSFTLASPTA